jgi:KUP system potassium uptake protein
MAQAPAEAPPPNSSANGAGGGGRGRAAAQAGFWALVLGSIGVVYGDIGTSPLYAFKESFRHVLQDGSLATREEVLGIVSLIFWALMIVVFLKYVVIVMQMDNKGEGGTLSLMALAQRALGRRTPLLFLIGVAGASMFYGDALITQAISVLSAF